MIGEEETPTLEETPAPELVVPQPLSPPVVVEASPPSVVAVLPPIVFASNEIRQEFRPAGLGAVPRRSSSSSSSNSRGRGRSSRPRVHHDRAWEDRERQGRRLRTETKLIAQLQGAVDIATRRLVVRPRRWRLAVSWLVQKLGHRKCNLRTNF